MEKQNNSASKREQKKAQSIHWLQTQVNDIMEPMMVEIFNS